MTATPCRLTSSGRVGRARLTRFFPAASVRCNVLAGGKASLYPTPNSFPTVADFNAGFVNAAAGDYTVRAGSVLAQSGCSGVVPGANIAAVQEATGWSVELAWVDQGYTGEEPAADADARGMELVVVRPPEAKKGFVLLPRRWVVERSFAWAARFRRLAKDYERPPETVAGLHFVAFACLMVHRLVTVAAQSP